MLGFRVDPSEKLAETARQIQSLHQVYGNCPIFGIEFEIEEIVCYNDYFSFTLSLFHLTSLIAVAPLVQIGSMCMHRLF